jgi:hypothetical protein
MAPSPISGRHGHARSETRSAKAGGELLGASMGFAEPLAMSAASIVDAS